MGLLIDTNVLIEHERGRLNLEPHLAGRGQEEFSPMLQKLEAWGAWEASGKGLGSEDEGC